MAALQSVGLVSSKDIEARGVSFYRKPIDINQIVKHYTMTEAAKVYALPMKTKGFGGGVNARTDLCWGKRALEAIVKWERPMILGNYQEAIVYFHHKIEDIAN
ncbi:hypothetical protein [Iodobacter fluviatilis]|nr:hypothetical protein [Iodobacter fluviatilis]